MRRGGKQGLLRRVRQFDTVHVTENMVNHASQLLQPYSEERVRTSSAGLGTFYKWVGFNICFDYSQMFNKWLFIKNDELYKVLHFCIVCRR